MSIFNAITIPFFGDSHVLRVEQSALPALLGGHILVKVIAAAVNPIDCKTRAGIGWAAKENQDNLPWIPGYDMAGVVTAVSDDTQTHLVNKLVFGMIGFPLKGGAYSEYTQVLPEDVLLLTPGMKTLDAAALPLAGLTAYQAIHQYGQVSAKQKVLILGATGGVGHIAAQLAQLAGAEVTAIGSKEKQAKLAPIGEHWVWLSRDEIADELLNGEFDLVLDCVGGKASVQLINLLASVSRYVTLPTVTAPLVKEAGAEKDIEVINFLVANNHQQLTKLANWVAAGQLKLLIEKVYPFNDVALAHQAVESGRLAGKALLSFD